MIPITPEIIGPGIEEEYGDAMARITFLLDAFKGHSPAENSAYGHVLHTLKWLKQEIEAQHLPIPVERGWIATMCYIVGSCEVDDTREVALALEELTLILKGPGLLKSRHFPLIAAQIEDLVAEIRYFGNPLTEDELKLVSDLEYTAVGIRSGTIIPPLEIRGPRHPLRDALIKAERLESAFPHFPDKRRFSHQSDVIELPLFEGWRPACAAKPPLLAPNPWPRNKPRDFTLVEDRERRQKSLSDPWGTSAPYFRL